MTRPGLHVELRTATVKGILGIKGLTAKGWPDMKTQDNVNLASGSGEATPINTKRSDAKGAMAQQRSQRGKAAAELGRSARRCFPIVWAR